MNKNTKLVEHIISCTGHMEIGEWIHSYIVKHKHLCVIKCMLAFKYTYYSTCEEVKVTLIFCVFSRHWSSIRQCH